MDLLNSIAGVLLIALALFDHYRTVLSTGESRGFIERNLSRLIWRIFRTVDQALKADGRMAAACGPLLVVALVAAWSALLILGFGLLYWPLLGSQIFANAGSAADSFSAALYFSGFALTTLGVGDVYPAFGIARFLTVLEAWMGFSVLTFTISYLLSVYQSVRQRNALAASLHAMTDGTGDSRELLARLHLDESPNSILNELRSEFAQLLTAHRQYPVIHYLVLPTTKLSTVRMFFLVCDYVALREALGIGRDDATFAGLRDILRNSVGGFSRMILSQTTVSAEEAEEEADRDAWDRRLDEAAARLNQLTDVQPVQPSDASRERYRAARVEWDGKLRAIAKYFDQDWERITEGQ